MGAGGIGGAGKTTVPFVKAAALGASSTTATSATGNAQESKAAGVESKGDCRFWLSDKGCRRGDRCKFKHGLLSPKENRCFFCSGLNHTRRDCPYVKKEFGKEENVKVAKMLGEDSQPSSPEREPLKVKVEEATGASGKKTEAEAGSGVAGGPMPNKSDSIDTLMGEASALLKSLRSAKVKAIKLKFMDGGGNLDAGTALGLLDGGATHPLRQALPGELEKSERVHVELAHGSIMLHQDPVTGTLLSADAVEPIVPVRGLIELGYKMVWSRSGCAVEHPRKGKIVSRLREGCPVVLEEDALLLIREIEEVERKKHDDVYREENLEEELLTWWSQRFPEVPARIFRYMTEEHDFGGGALPWNRRQRRRLLAAKRVVLHLFAGEKADEWEELKKYDCEVITLDIMHNKSQDLHNPVLWAFLMRLARQGTLAAIIGGPPCRTVSRLRFRRPGPRPLRDRGAHRFGLPNLSVAEQRLADHDAALVIKQVGLYLATEEAKVEVGGPKGTTGFLLESPADPAKMVGDGGRMLSFWSWPEVLGLLEEESMGMVTRLDQGAVGHSKKKPTSLLTNMPGMMELHGLRARGDDEPLPDDIQASIQASKSWSLWAPGLRAAIKESLRCMLEQGAAQQRKIAKLSQKEKDMWATHFRQGHRPFRRDCRLCIEQAGTQKPHRRRGDTQRMSSVWSVAVDIVGPLSMTRDGASGRVVRYAMIAVALVPDFNAVAEDDVAEKDVAEETVVEKDVAEKDVAAKDGAEDQRDEKVPTPKEDSTPEQVVAPEPGEDVGVMEEEQDIMDPAHDYDFEAELQKCQRGVPLKHVTCMEVLESRAKAEVIVGLQKLITKYKAMGVAVNRLHTDRAKELISKQVEAWCSRWGIVQTSTGGDDPAANGHVEAEVNQVKRRARLLLAQHECAGQIWPSAMRYAVEERRRRQLEELGVPTLPMLPFYATVYVKAKKWHKEGGLMAPFVKGRLMCPSAMMNDGWVVQAEDGKILHVREAVQPNTEAEDLRRELEDQQAQVRLQLEEEPRPGQPYHRMWRKQSLDGQPRLPQAGGQQGATMPTAGGTSSPSSSTALGTASGAAGPGGVAGETAGAGDARPGGAVIWRDDPLAIPISTTSSSSKGVRTLRVETGDKGALAAVDIEPHYQGARWLSVQELEDSWSVG